MFIFKVVVFTTSWILAPNAFAVNSGITYHGRILDSSNNPIVDSNVSFKMQIRTPDAGSCLMYEEIQAKDLSSSVGSFSITINDGTGSRTDTSGVNFDRIFANYGSLSFSVATCASGTGNWTPNSSDGRAFQVSFKTSTMSTWEPMPAQSINFAPFAIEAKQVAGFPGASLFRVENGTGPQTVTSLSPAQATVLLNLAQGTTQYVTKTAAGAALPSFASDPATPITGDVWYDSTNKVVKYYDGTAVQIIGSGGAVSGNSITSGTIGGSTSMNTSGSVTAASLSSTTDATQNLQLYNTGNTHKVTVTVPASLAADYPLQLPGALPATSGLVLSSTTAGVTSWSQAYTNGGNSWAGPATLGTNDNNTLAFKTNNATAVTIDTSGKVGIGTTTPTQLLDVAGPIRIAPAALPGIPIAGDLAFDSGASNALKFYNGTGWQTVGTGSGGGDFMANGSVAMTGNFNAGNNQVLLYDGSQFSAPGLAFSSEPGMGLFRTGPHVMSFVALGSRILDLTSTGTKAQGTMAVQWPSSTAYASSSGTLAQPAAITNGPAAIVTNITPTDNTAAYLGFKVNNTSGTGQSGFVGFYATPGSFSPTFVLGQQTGASSYQERLRVDASGNVGIGTTAPGSPLTVNGVIESKTGGIKFPDGTTQTTAAVGGGSSQTSTNTFTLNSNSDGTGSDGGLNLQANGSNIFQVSNGGAITTFGNITGNSALNVASGGTNQNLGLASSGNGAVNVATGNGTGLSVLDPGAASANYVTVKGAATGNAPVIGTAGADTNINLILTPKGTGNVGIGTSSPSDTLDVVGNFINLTAVGQYDGFYLQNGGGTVASLSGTAAGNDNGALNLFTGGVQKVQVVASGSSYFNGGNVGIGTTTPHDLLEVDGATRVVATGTVANTTLNGAATNSQTSLTVVSTTGYPSSGTVWIDSEAMSFTGKTGTTFTGLTRGVLGTTAATHASGSTILTSAFVISNGSVPTFVAQSDGSVRAGYNTTASGGYSTAFGNGSTGSGATSVAMGNNSLASGAFAVALGNGSWASGQSTSAMGVGSHAAGDFSTAIGYTTTASGTYSAAIGNLATAPSYSEMAVGSWNVTGGETAGSWVATDPIFVVGNGQPGAPSNAMTILKNGNVGIGTTTPGSPFTVNGVIESKTGGVKFPDGTTQTTAASSGGGAQSSTSNFVLNSNSDGTGTDGGFDFQEHGSSIFKVSDTGGITTYGNITGNSALAVAAGGTNQNLALLSSGTGAVNVGTGNGTGFSVLDPGVASANYITVKGAATGSAPAIGTAGADTNINLVLTPKGTGNVGIGTTTPLATLSIGGSGFPGTGLAVQAPAGGSYSIMAIEAAGNHMIDLKANTGGYNLITSDWLSSGPYLPLALSGRENPSDLVLNNGNVGIGTTAPGNALEVNGTIATTITGTESTLNGAITAVSPTITLANAAGYPPSGTLWIPGAGNPELVTYSSKAGNVLTVASRGAYGTTAQAFGSGTAAHLIRMIASNSGTQPGGFFEFGNGAAAIATPEGNYNPGGYSLVVGFNSQSAGSYSFANGSGARSNGVNSLASGNGVSPNGSNSQAMGDNLAAASFDQHVIGAYNKAVGGETAASWVATDPLFVVGNGASGSTSNALLMFKNGASLFNGGATVALPTANVSLTVMGTTTTNAAAALNATDSAGSSKLFVRNDGNVGIGTTTPAGNLAVDNAGHNATICLNGTCSTTIGGGAQSSASNFVLNSNSDGTGTDGGFDFQEHGSSIFKISDTGGITTYGNITGNSALAVAAGGTNQNLALLSSGTGAVNVGTGNGTGFSVLDPGVASANYVTVKGASTGNAPVIGTAGADTNINLLLTPKGTGNVGIGTTTPAGNLAIDNVGHNATLCLNGTCTSSISGSGLVVAPSSGSLVGGTTNASTVTTASLDNTVYGYHALHGLTSGAGNQAFGGFALGSNTSGSNNTSIGFQALVLNTTGGQNVAVGNSALYNNTGNSNTAVGYQALQNNLGGANNVALGLNALSVNTTGNNNVSLGGIAGGNITTGSNNITIGFGANAPSASSDNQLNIGNLIFGTGMNGSVASPAGNVGIGTTVPAQPLDVFASVSSGGSKAISSYAYIPVTTSGVLGEVGAGTFSALNDSGGTTISKVLGAEFFAENTANSTINTVLGHESWAGNSGGTVGTLTGALIGVDSDGGTVTTVTGTNTYANISSGSTTDLRGLAIELDNSGGTVTNRYGIFLSTPTGTATNDYGIYQSGTQKNYFAGKVGIGTTTPGATLDVNGEIRGTHLRGLASVAYTSGPSAGQYTLSTGAGSSPGSISVNGNDVATSLSFSLGTSPATGTIATINFTNSFGTAPNCVVSATTAAAAQSQVYVTSTTSSVVVKSASALSSVGASYGWNIHCLN